MYHLSDQKHAEGNQKQDHETATKNNNRRYRGSHTASVAMTIQSATCCNMSKPADFDVPYRWVAAEAQWTATRRPGVRFPVGTVYLPSFLSFARDSKWGCRL